MTLEERVLAEIEELEEFLVDAKGWRIRRRAKRALRRWRKALRILRRGDKTPLELASGLLGRVLGGIISG